MLPKKKKKKTLPSCLADIPGFNVLYACTQPMLLCQGDLAARGWRALKIRVRLRPALPRPAHHNYIYILGNMSLTFVSSIPSPPPVPLTPLFWPLV
jgi:hypothetical protein